MMQSLDNKKSEFSIHPATRMGNISLIIANLENQINFYQNVMGFELHWRQGKRAGLGSGSKELLLLTEQPDVKKYRNVTGLYHVAYLFPNRRELARAMARLFAHKYPNAPTDHILTKTTYLDDPEGNGIELYCESPEDGTWSMANGDFTAQRADGSPSNGREPLDVKALFSHLTPDDRLDAPIPQETRIGHMHLHVRDVDEAVNFYHGILGFDLMGNARAMQAAFVSAGGYHHHIGLNTWQGRGAPPPPANATGLDYFSIELPDQVALNDVVARAQQAGIPANQFEDGLLLSDPSLNKILLRSKTS